MRDGIAVVGEVDDFNETVFVGSVMLNRGTVLNVEKFDLIAGDVSDASKAALAEYAEDLPGSIIADVNVIARVFI